MLLLAVQCIVFIISAAVVDMNQTSQSRVMLQNQCSGSLISNKYVLTSAHCIKKELHYVHLGDHNLATNPDCEEFSTGPNCYPAVQRIAVKRVIRHNGYSIKNNNNDIALIELNTAARIKREDVNTVCLPLDQLSISTQSVTIAGWGLNTSQYTNSLTLQRMSVPAISWEKCTRFRPMTDPKQFCSGLNADPNFCCANPGGAVLMFPEGSIRHTQYGIVSHGERRCATLQHPAVYTDITQYMHWILDKIST